MDEQGEAFSHLVWESNHVRKDRNGSTENRSVNLDSTMKDLKWSASAISLEIEIEGGALHTVRIGSHAVQA